MAKFFNRVKVAITSTGTGSVTCGAALAGFQSLADASVANGDVVRYTIIDGNSYESGTGTVTLSGSTYSISRGPSVSSESNNSAIDVASSANLFLTMLAQDVKQVLSDLDNVSTTAPAGGQVLSYDTNSASWVPSSPSGGIVSVANYAALPASPSATDLAWTQDTKSLYIYDGTEWDRFYTDTNATPDWTTEPPTIPVFLETDGTATVQTVAASDPEGFPIEYSYDTNPSNQAQATISQSNNVFTITPSTSEANEGSFTLRYRASDGIHSTSRSTSYELTFYTNPNLQTASYANKSLNIASYEIAPYCMEFKPDGTKLFIGGYGSDGLKSFTLSTAWDISTASHDTGVFLDVSSQEGTLRALCFNGDGTSLFIGGSSADKVFKYDMTTAYDLSTASYSNVDFNPTDTGGNISDLSFNNTGTKLFINAATRTLYEYNLSTAYDITTASYSSNSLNLATYDSYPYSVTWNKFGDKLYMTGWADDIVQFDLTTAFDLSTASYSSIEYHHTPSNYANCVRFSVDARKMFICDGNGRYIYEHST